MKEHMSRIHGSMQQPRVKVDPRVGEDVLCTRCRRRIATVAYDGVYTRDGKGNAVHDIDLGPDRPGVRYVAARCKRCKRLHFLEWGYLGQDPHAGRVIKWIDPPRD